ncbi:leucine-rich repeat domain-containing protein [bacterium]|nr:leucine-rich repeat domain-containing protein [bacterium]
MNQIIEQIKKKLVILKKSDYNLELFGAKEHQYNLNPRASENDIIDFEKKYKIKLPEDYRNFLLYAGDGGAGPSFGILSFDESIKTFIDSPFPFSTEDAQKIVETRVYEDPYYFRKIKNKTIGDSIKISNYGSSWSLYLVIKGEQNGFLWMIGEGAYPLFYKKSGNSYQLGFLDWYYEWIANYLKLYAIHTQPKEPINTPEKIKSIRYEWKKLSNIPEKTFLAKNVEEIWLNYNKLTSLPKEINVFQRLISLSCEWNRIDRVSDSIGELKQLKFLYLKHNNIENLPESIGDLKNLESLSLAYNRISEIPNSIFNLDSLIHLNLDHNIINEISENIGKLKSLQELFLGENRLESVPDSISKLKNLRILNLKQNNIQFLPKSFSKLTKLKKLSLRGNHNFKFDLETLSILESLPLLTDLSLSKTEFPENLSKLKQIRVLSIVDNPNYNKKFNFPEGVLSWSSLRELYLEGLSIESLPENIDSLTKLKKLYLADNKIEKIPDSIKKLTKLQILSLEGNPISLQEINRLTELLPYTKILHSFSDLA